MRRRPFGETGLDCSEIGLGTWALGSGVYGEVERAEAHNLICQALDIGINFLIRLPYTEISMKMAWRKSCLGKV